MSGHSKWSTIKHKKGAADAKRGKIFTKLIKEVTVAARQGGGDPDGNPRLRTAIDKAKAENMPGENIARAIKKGTGELEGVNYDEITYEGYGPGGTAVLVECLTDNRNRTVAELKHVFGKANGSIGKPGTVAFKFEAQGHLRFPKTEVDEDRIMEAAMEAGADDYTDDGDDWLVTTLPTEFLTVREAFEATGLKPSEAEVTKVPNATIKLVGRDAEVMLKLYMNLDDHDDVQNVYADFDIDDELMEELMGSIRIGAAH